MEFKPFPKIARLSRDVTITEKIDGTNASVTLAPVNSFELTEDHREKVATLGGFHIFAGSRTRWITPAADNYGFAAWVHDNAEGLLELGEGSHFGEWWGRGIQRNYSQTERHFSLFNTKRWGTHFDDQGRVGVCRVVPTLYQGPLDDHEVMKGVKKSLLDLANFGSKAAPGFMKPEGIIIFHQHSNSIFKKTLEHDDKSKEHGG